MNPLFSCGMIQPLIALESSLEKQFDLPVTALCAYTRDNAEKKKKEEEVNLLLR